MEVEYKGLVIYLSDNLIKERGLTKDEITRLISLCEAELIVKDFAQNWILKHNDFSLIKVLAKLFVDIALLIQEAWKQKPDVDKVQWWMFPGCTCSENGFALDCPVHDDSFKNYLDRKREELR